MPFSTIAIIAVPNAYGYLIEKKMDNAMPVEFTKKIVKISEICKDAVPYITDPDRFSKSAMETITFREPKYGRLLKEAQEVLGLSEASDEFDLINKLRLKNRAIRNEITELKKKNSCAPGLMDAICDYKK